MKEEIEYIDRIWFELLENQRLINIKPFSFSTMENKEWLPRRLPWYEELYYRFIFRKEIREKKMLGEQMKRLSKRRESLINTIQRNMPMAKDYQLTHIE